LPVAFAFLLSFVLPLLPAHASPVAAQGETLPANAAQADTRPQPTAYVQAQRPISTTNAAAAAQFDDGLTLLYAFNPAGARASFENAAKLDPTLAIAWWGIAMSHGININTSYDPAEQRAGRDAIVRATNLERGASPAERALIDAAARRFAYDRSTEGDRSARAYRDAMNAAAAAFPLDDDVQVLAAEAEMDVHPWSFFTPGGMPVEGMAGAIARLDAVLARTPEHIGANHLLIHAWEESSHPENALVAARRLAAMNFEPGAEHLAHMPAHAFLRVGAYYDAGEANARAIALYVRYVASNAPDHASYINHDCAFGAYAFMMAGSYSRAQEIAAACIPFGSRLAADVELRFRRYDALAAAADEDDDDFSAGMLCANAGRSGAAARHLGVLRKLAGDVASIEADVLAAAIARTKQDQSGEIASLTHAVATQDGSGYEEPPEFFFPVRETLGGAYYRYGRYHEAERTFRDDLTHDAENPRALYGLAETLDKEGRTSEASQARARFLKAWAQADTQLDMKDY
jgi:Tfp pilus assembly protein PilF